MKYLTDREIEALSIEEKLNMLKIIDFQKISDNICDECAKGGNCYYTECDCDIDWSEILTNMVKAEQDLQRGMKAVETFNETFLSEENEWPLTHIQVTEHGMYSVPYYG